jgi:hypothetical protein
LTSVGPALGLKLSSPAARPTPSLGLVLELLALVVELVVHSHPGNLLVVRPA